MTMRIDDGRPIIKTGNSLTITLSKEFKELGLKRGDKPIIRFDGKYIVISSNKINMIEGKIIGVNTNLWNKFSNLAKKYMKHTTPEAAVEETLEDFCKKYSSFLNRPIIKG